MIYELKGEDGALIQVVSKGIDMDYVFHPLRIYLCTLLAFFFFIMYGLTKKANVHSSCQLTTQNTDRPKALFSSA